MCKKYSLGNEVRVSKANQYLLDVDSVKQVEHIVAAMEAAGGREVTRHRIAFGSAVRQDK